VFIEKSFQHGFFYESFIKKNKNGGENCCNFRTSFNNEVKR